MEQWLTPPLIISLAALALSVLNSYRSSKKDNKQEFDKRFQELENDIEKLEEKAIQAATEAKVVSLQVGLFWKNIEQQIAPRFMAPKSRDE